MSDVILEVNDAVFRHPIASPSIFKPFATKSGPGIFSINLTLKRGQILGLVGPNGAGKTTLIRMLAGILPIQEGSVEIRHPNSENMNIATPLDLRSIVGHMPEQVRWQGKISVKNMLLELAEMRGVSFRVDGLLKMVGLSSRADSQLDQLSQGMRQRLTLASALLGSPKILLLDEPFNGLDPVAGRAFEQLLLDLTEKGVSIVISSHRVAGMVHLVDRLALLHRGQLLIEGTLDEIEKEYNLNDRIEIEGKGRSPNFESLIDSSSSIVETKNVDSGWKVIIQNPNHDLLKRLISTEIDVTTWKSMETDIVELICSATGLDVTDIGFDVVSSSMMPYRVRGEEE